MAVGAPVRREHPGADAAQMLRQGNLGRRTGADDSWSRPSALGDRLVRRCCPAQPQQTNKKDCHHSAKDQLAAVDPATSNKTQQEQREAEGG